MILTKSSLIDRQGPLKGSPGSFQIAQVMKHEPNVIDIGGSLRMFRTKRLGVQRQSSSQLRLGVHHITKFMRKPAEVAKIRREVGMVRSKVSLPCFDADFKIVSLATEVVHCEHRGYVHLRPE